MHRIVAVVLALALPFGSALGADAGKKAQVMLIGTYHFSNPGQDLNNVKAVDVQIPPELLTRIDDVLGDVVVRDPAMTAATAPARRPA